jgi:hypothetical protein
MPRHYLCGVCHRSWYGEKDEHCRVCHDPACPVGARLITDAQRIDVLARVHPDTSVVDA